MSSSGEVSGLAGFVPVGIVGGLIPFAALPFRGDFFLRKNEPIGLRVVGLALLFGLAVERDGPIEFDSFPLFALSLELLELGQGFFHDAVDALLVDGQIDKGL